MLTPELFTRLTDSKSVLIAGAGGGFDIYAGLPLAFTLWDTGVSVHLANLSFTDTEVMGSCGWLADSLLAAVSAGQGRQSETYFPELTLATWLSQQGYPDTVYALARTGVPRLRTAYQVLADRLQLDAIILIDGGTDMLLRGDEYMLGTPEEDAASLAAVAGLHDIPVRLATCLGFGIDSFHGVNHVHVLENIADLDRDGAYLGAFSIPSHSSESQRYKSAVEHAASATPNRPSIVNHQISAALSGQHGNMAMPGRKRVDDLFVNPLMGMYFTFDLPGLAAHNLYLPRLEDTIDLSDISARIGQHRAGLELRPPRTFPH
ncbi:DUF1152 domain-containing protein [Nocardia macrotermitis]|uniref:DUF1152 domain-containing protein n=1 Tax=Nocardia macrotermitis TaxID=2585198 RepID=A0A7K0D4Q1_9NOCA|nr:DUF1152 domain-containing protein [Nocardia macrotermitis]MQY20700.1 hypothetical protein [Nocardia macrotermitis]